MIIILKYFQDFNPIILALLAGIFTWGLTAFGASFIFFHKKHNQRFLDFMLGFASGVMLSATFWALLLPALEISAKTNVIAWLPLAIGFSFGAFSLSLIDKILPHLHLGFPKKEAEGLKTKWHRNILLLLAVTLHNIPEGLAIGMAFGVIATNFEQSQLLVAITLTLGIGLQNIPEGFAIAAPLKKSGFSNFKSFWYGQLSAIVEPIFSVIGALLVFAFEAIIPYALSFAAGAMFFVVIEELIPESQRNKNTDLATLGAVLGFVLMMVLDLSN